MSIDRVFADRGKAITDIFDGATIMIGGWAGWAGVPIGLIRALRNRGTRDITLIAINSGCQIRYSNEEWADHGQLFEAQQVRKVICCSTWPGSYWARAAGVLTDPLGPAVRQIMAGKVELELVPLGTLVERIRAGGANLGGFYTQVGVGTVVEKGKERKVINNREYILELPLIADFAFLRAYKADRMGNLVYRVTARGISHAVATAAKVTIAEVEEIVNVGDLHPEQIHTPAIYVDRVVKIPENEIIWRRKIWTWKGA